MIQSKLMIIYYFAYLIVILYTISTAWLSSTSGLGRAGVVIRWLWLQDLETLLWLVAFLSIVYPCTQVKVGKGTPDFDPSEDFIRTGWKMSPGSISVVDSVIGFYPLARGSTVPIIFMVIDSSGARLTPREYVGHLQCHGDEQWRRTRCHPDLCGTVLYSVDVVPTFA
ncbi:unnamed protein product [Musa acuminata subsp. burmannicoides]